MRILVCTNLGQGDKRCTVNAQTVGTCGSASLQLAGHLCFLREQINFSFESEFFLRLDLSCCTFQMCRMKECDVEA